MAYQEVTQANIVLNQEIAATGRFFAGIGAWFGQIAQNMAMASEGQRRVNQVHALQDLSDDQLKRLNIRRDDIVHHVFGDLYHI
ncbi:hypothetical protein Z945_2539 [Sulfitobacter noctilucae]|uniref:DUF1127 domain-containing protein n=1 Tax=Sulfitobacter noctilucae TaxID=1342302 RepID=UPI00055D6177|nr:DUF1127 domain-containing protein [Sulfitobacter noctilucae]KIN61547.1 hypothetical protein Z945_2539 [Sulfitobacter noctilucae]